MLAQQLEYGRKIGHRQGVSGIQLERAAEALFRLIDVLESQLKERPFAPPGPSFPKVQALPQQVGRRSKFPSSAQPHDALVDFFRVGSGGAALGYKTPWALLGFVLSAIQRGHG
jgi:hypothetical protein